MEALEDYKNDAKVVIGVDQRLKDALDRQCDELDKTTTKVVRKLITNWLAEQGVTLGQIYGWRDAE
jgi:hypothetical protein